PSSWVTNRPSVPSSRRGTGKRPASSLTPILSGYSTTLKLERQRSRLSDLRDPREALNILASRLRPPSSIKYIMSNLASRLRSPSSIRFMK
ncbi:unnamed protein product, partial [Cochlearia groenlandica]